MIRKVPDGDYNWSLYGHVNKTRSHTSHQALTHFGHNKIFILSTSQGVQAACEEIYLHWDSSHICKVNKGGEPLLCAYILLYFSCRSIYAEWWSHTLWFIMTHCKLIFTITHWHYGNPGLAESKYFSISCIINSSRSSISRLCCSGSATGAASASTWVVAGAPTTSSPCSLPIHFSQIIIDLTNSVMMKHVLNAV